MHHARRDPLRPRLNVPLPSAQRTTMSAPPDLGKGSRVLLDAEIVMEISEEGAAAWKAQIAVRSKTGGAGRFFGRNWPRPELVAGSRLTTGGWFGNTCRPSTGQGRSTTNPVGLARQVHLHVYPTVPNVCLARRASTNVAIGTDGPRCKSGFPE